MLAVSDVKKELPQIRVKFNGRMFWGRLSGRLNPEATVTIFGGYSYALNSHYVDFKASWDTVTRIVNNPKLYLKT
jgi:hypothetical protein